MMLHSRLALAACVVASLAISVPSSADFLGVSTELVAQPTIDGVEWDVWRVYVEVTDPLDQVTFCSGNGVNPVNIDAGGPSGFYQNTTFGPNDIEPVPALIAVDPDLAYDTYVTIGAELLTGPATQVQNLASPGYRCDKLLVRNGAWYRLPTAPQTYAGPLLRVMVAQFTVGRGATLRGKFRVAGVFDGDSGDVYLPELPNALCDEDVTGDGVIGVDDLLDAVLAWGPCDDICACPADVTRDDGVDVDDLLAILSAWGTCAP